MPPARGFDRHDGVQAVVLTGKERERLKLGDIRVGSGHFALDFVQERIALGHVGLFFGEVKIRLDVRSAFARVWHRTR